MSASTQGRLDLYKTLVGRRFDHAVLCTYEFGPLFFEKDCLENFRALPENSNISVVLDRGVYERLISSNLNALEQANLRYLLHPVSFSTRGVFHPKLFLFVTAKKGLLIIGSANLTEAGLKTNAEMVGEYTFEWDKQEEYLSLFQQAFEFLSFVAKECPSEAFCSHLSEIAAQAPWLTDEPAASETLPVRLIHNLERPLWPQICDGVRDSAESLHILAPYYDSSPAILQRMHQDLQPRQINIYTQNHTTTLTKKWLQDPLVKASKAKIHLCTYRDEDHRQSLHAKAIAVLHGSSCCLAFGNANCSSAALLKKANQGNVEIMLIADVPKSKLNPKRLFDPIGEAQLLTHEDMLVTAAQEPNFSRSAPRDVTLHEATVVGQTVRCWISVKSHLEDALPGELKAVLTLNNQERHSLFLTHVEGMVYTASLSEELLQKSLEASSVVHVEGRVEPSEDDVSISNSILLTNLQDGETGVSLRRRRQLRQAEQSAAGFLLAWNDLLNSGDDHSLMDFLMFCNIPVSAARPLTFLRDRPQWMPVAGMQPIATKNLPWFRTLDDAAIAFINKHLVKLRTHLNHPGLEGAPNFMHIALSIAGVVQAQAERAAVTLERFGEPLPVIITTEEWSEWKKHFDRYYYRFEELLIAVAKYVKVLQEEWKQREVQAVLKIDINSLCEAINYMLSLQERVEESRTQRLRIILPSGSNIPPTYSSANAFQQNIFAPHNWDVFRTKIEAMKASLSD